MKRRREDGIEPRYLLHLVLLLLRCSCTYYLLFGIVEQMLYVDGLGKTDLMLLSLSLERGEDHIQGLMLFFTVEFDVNVIITGIASIIVIINHHEGIDISAVHAFVGSASLWLARQDVSGNRDGIVS